MPVRVDMAPFDNSPRGTTEPATKADTHRMQIRPQRFTTYSTSSIYAWLQEDLIEFDQQGVLWTDAKQIGLIHSCFNNYYIPPLIFSVRRDFDGGEIRVCLDGKQRLTSIRRFMLGEIPSKNGFPDFDGYFNDLSGPNKKLITVSARSIFMNKQLACVEYEDLTADQEREIFQSRIRHKAQPPSAIQGKDHVAKTQDVAAKFRMRLGKQRQKRRLAIYQDKVLLGLRALGKGQQTAECLDGAAVRRRGKRMRQEVDERLILPMGTRRKIKKPSREPALVCPVRRI